MLHKNTSKHGWGAHHFYHYTCTLNVKNVRKMVLKTVQQMFLVTFLSQIGVHSSKMTFSTLHNTKQRKVKITERHGIWWIIVVYMGVEGTDNSEEN